MSIDKNENMSNAVKSFLNSFNLQNDVFNKYKIVIIYMISNIQLIIDYKIIYLLQNQI